jgi:WD40 repeat protein
VNGVAIAESPSGDGRNAVRIVSGGFDGTIRLWDIDIDTAVSHLLWSTQGSRQLLDTQGVVLRQVHGLQESQRQAIERAGGPTTRDSAAA